MKLSLQYALLYSSLFVGAKLSGVNAKLRFRQTPDATINAVVDRELQFTATGAESTSYTAADTTTAETTTTETTQTEQQVATTTAQQQQATSSSTTASGGGSSSSCANCASSGTSGYSTVDKTSVSKTSGTGKFSGTSKVSGGSGSTKGTTSKTTGAIKQGGISKAKGGLSKGGLSKAKGGLSKAKGGLSKAKGGLSKGGSKGKGGFASQASQATCGSSTGQCCQVNLADATTGSCVVGTKVDLVSRDLTSVLDTFTVSSADQCSCLFNYQQTAENYCIKVTPVSGFHCNGECVTYLTSSSTNVTSVYTSVVKTTTTETTTTTTETSTVNAQTTGTVTIHLFQDNDKDKIQDETDANLTGLSVQLVSAADGSTKTLTTKCHDNVFSDVAPGWYTVTSQTASGYACDCMKKIEVMAGADNTVYMAYAK